MFEKIEVNKILDSDINKMDILKQLMFEYNAILAGGSALALSRGYSIEKHLTKNSSSDIDLYFRNQKDYYRAVNFARELECKGIVMLEKSVTGLCHNLYTREKIQLVGCVFGTPKDIVTSFDFFNLEVCYFAEAGDLKKLYSTRSRSDIIDIRHTRSPFLMHRIYKYIKYRGYKGVTERARSQITDWLIKASTGFYYKNTDGCPTIYVDLLNNNYIKFLLDKDRIISDDDLAFLIGKVTEDVTETSGVTSWKGYTKKIFKKIGTKDLAIEQIKKRMKDERQKEIC